MAVSKNKINKMKAGRKKYIAETHGLILKIDDRVEIWGDRNGYVLKINGRKKYTNPSPAGLIKDHFIDLELKKYLVANPKKDIAGVLETINNFEKRMNRLLSPLNLHISVHSHNDS